jgi:hypothetical protein
MAYHVDWVGSAPEEANDDCWCGTVHETIEAARLAFHGSTPAYAAGCTAVVTLTDDTGNEIARRYIRRQDAPSRTRDASECSLEHARQCGMAFGCDGYNDAMGY